MTLSCLASEQTDPYCNLALEEYLLRNVSPDECILYLWQNRRAVVIGVNQNPWRECRIRALEDDGGFLARRMSGGGAVYHDLGNLNFTFIAHESGYNASRQSEVVMRSVSLFGIQVERSERNDLTAGGRKFSGNAFYSSGGRRYHHGTLLVDADLSALSRYLNAPPAKWQSKGVESIPSRVVNLKELSPAITVSALRAALATSFGEVYGSTPQPFSPDRLDREQIARYEEKYTSREWRLGRRLPFTAEYNRRFTWSDLTLRFHVEGGIIQEAIACSDRFTQILSPVGEALKGSVFAPAAIKARLYAFNNTKSIDAAMLADVVSLIDDIF